MITNELLPFLCLVRKWPKGRSATFVGGGAGNTVHVSPRDIYRRLLRERAVACVVIHNHPSGDPAPSREDEALTKRLVDVGTLHDLHVSDHIIIGNGTGEFFSFAEKGLI